jgi:type IV pilus assembly protein PilB
MLVQAQMLRAEQVAEALALQRQQGGRLGELLVELGHVSEIQLAQVLSNQLSIPWVNLYHIDFSRELLNLVSADTAEKYRCIPVYVRRVRNQGETLFVATDDPTQELALAEIAVQANMPVKPLVASSSDVRNAIRVYYFGGKASAATAPIKRRSSSVAPARSIPPVELDESELETDEHTQKAAKPAKPAPPAAPVKPVEAVKPATAPEAKAEPVAVTSEAPKEAATPKEEAAAPAPSPQRKKKGKMLTLTFLDGTSVTLPQAGAKKGEERSAGDALTTRDLIAALKARAEGKDVSAVLPDGRWEPIVAAALSLLLRKGLIADWEFVEEWSKHKK